MYDFPLVGDVLNSIIFFDRFLPWFDRVSVYFRAVFTELRLFAEIFPQHFELKPSGVVSEVIEVFGVRRPQFDWGRFLMDFRQHSSVLIL